MEATQPKEAMGKQISRLQFSDAEHIVCSYISKKIHQNDIYDSIEIGEPEGVSTLLFIRRVGGNECSTYFYLYGGYFKELFIRRDSFAGANICRWDRILCPYPLYPWKG